jgi:hypothetical protein
MTRYAQYTKPVVQPIEDGQYPAIIYQLIDLGSKMNKAGTQRNTPQMMIGFEFPSMTYETKDGIVLSQVKSITTYVSLNPSSQGYLGLHEIITGVSGEELTEEQMQKFDIDSLIGKTCMITLASVESKGQVYSNIIAINFLPEGLKPVAVRPNISVTIDDFRNIENIGIPDWIKNKIKESEEYKDIQGTLSMSNDVNQVQMNGKVEEVSSLADDNELKIEDIPF